MDHSQKEILPYSELTIKKPNEEDFDCSLRVKSLNYFLN